VSKGVTSGEHTFLGAGLGSASTLFAVF